MMLPKPTSSWNRSAAGSASVSGLQLADDLADDAVVGLRPQRLGPRLRGGRLGRLVRLVCFRLGPLPELGDDAGDPPIRGLALELAEPIWPKG